jgi:hypothetical protein
MPAHPPGRRDHLPHEHARRMYLSNGVRYAYSRSAGNHLLGPGDDLASAALLITSPTSTPPGPTRCLMLSKQDFAAHELPPGAINPAAFSASASSRQARANDGHRRFLPRRQRGAGPPPQTILASAAGARGAAPRAPVPTYDEYGEYAAPQPRSGAARRMGRRTDHLRVVPSADRARSTGIACGRRCRLSGLPTAMGRMSPPPIRPSAGRRLRGSYDVAADCWRRRSGAADRSAAATPTYTPILPPRFRSPRHRRRWRPWDSATRPTWSIWRRAELSVAAPAPALPKRTAAAQRPHRPFPPGFTPAPAGRFGEMP